MNPTIERFLGRLFRRVRADDRYLVCHQPPFAQAPATLQLASPAFADGAAMPARYAGKKAGDNISPPLQWSNLPGATAELLLVMQDPDAPMHRPVMHMVVMGIPPACTAIPEGALAAGSSQFMFGRGAFGSIGYHGPGPVRGHGPHRYIFQLFALAEPLGLPARSKFTAITARLTRPPLARGQLTGTFERL